jgi:hypothetical protein
MHNKKVPKFFHLHSSWHVVCWKCGEKLSYMWIGIWDLFDKNFFILKWRISSCDNLKFCSQYVYMCVCVCLVFENIFLKVECKSFLQSKYFPWNLVL